MDAVSSLVADLDVTEVTLASNPRQAVAVPAAHTAKPAVSKSFKERSKATDKQPAAVQEAVKQVKGASAAGRHAAVAGKQAAAGVRGKATAAKEVAEESQDDKDSPSNSRPARQRSKAQPYWMGGAGSNSPASLQAQADPSASANIAATREEEPAEQSDDHAAKADKAGRAKKAAVAKRQTRSSPHKEQHQHQQPAKRARAATRAQREAGQKVAISTEKQAEAVEQHDEAREDAPIEVPQQADQGQAARAGQKGSHLAGPEAAAEQQNKDSAQASWQHANPCSVVTAAVFHAPVNQLADAAFTP